MLPVVALVGRPNVGKSTIFNQLTRSRNALVANFSGLTRDRQYGDAQWLDRRFMVIDTGGLTIDEQGIDSAMADQSWLATKEADVIVFVVDCKDGLTVIDQAIAKQLRTLQKPILIVANKIDGQQHEVAIAPFFELGFGEILPTTASHGRGVRSLAESIVAAFPEQAEDSEITHEGIKMAVVGRPNVGKSTLVNRLLGEERVVVYDQPGTTRDSIYIHYERNDRQYTLIDTAGVRRRKNIKETIEKFSIVKTLQAIDDANVVILLMDATEGLVDQDLHLLGNAIDAGRALVVALNKWDGLDDEHKQNVKRELDRRLQFLDFADVHFISALHGTGVGHLYESVHKAYQSATDRFSTNHLTNILKMAVSEHQPPLVRGHRIKLRFAHAGGHNPPIIVIHGNQTEDVPKHYERYLEKTFRRALKLHGTPIKIQFKTGDNPFKDKKNKLTTRQLAKKRRLMQHKQHKKKN